jgi:hypothetical protein
MYRIGLQTADRMFGEVLAMLERKGALRNAVVVVLSDHGEALNLPSDSFFDDTFHVTGLGAPLKMSPLGHGQSVLSKSQYQILLAFRTFGTDHAVGNGRDLRVLATAEDIAPTLLAFLGVDAGPLTSTGMSLLPAMRSTTNADTAEQIARRIRFTETDLAVLPAPGGGVDEIGTAKQNAMFFSIDPRTARLHLSSRYVPLATTFKERAAYSRDQLIAAIPAGPYAHQYIYIDFAGRHGQLLLDRPGPDTPEAQRLWDALHEHYAGELRRPVRTTRADWPRIRREWERFSVPAEATQANNR